MMWQEINTTKEIKMRLKTTIADDIKLNPLSIHTHGSGCKIQGRCAKQKKVVDATVVDATQTENLSGTCVMQKVNNLTMIET